MRQIIKGAIEASAVQGVNFPETTFQNHVLSICVGNADAWANVSPPPVSKFSHGAWERVVSTSGTHAAGTRVKVDGP